MSLGEQFYKITNVFMVLVHITVRIDLFVIRFPESWEIGGIRSYLLCHQFFSGAVSSSVVFSGQDFAVNTDSKRYSIVLYCIKCGYGWTFGAFLVLQLREFRN
jgi:hypothetical protein